MFISATVVAIPIGLKGLIEAPMWYRPFDWVVLGKVLFMLLFSTMVANVLTVTALRYISSFKASVYTYLTPLMGAVVSIWLGIQHLNWQDAISFCLIVCGFIFVNLKQHQREQNIHEPVGIH